MKQQVNSRKQSGNRQCGHMLTRRQHDVVAPLQPKFDPAGGSIRSHCPDSMLESWCEAVVSSSAIYLIRMTAKCCEF